MNKITQLMIDEFNEFLKSKESEVSIQRSEHSQSWEIGLKDPFVKNSVSNVNVTDDFYKLLEAHLDRYGIHKISYNNIGSCFWKF